MIGPTKKPSDFGFKKGDTHLIVNDITETVKAYDHVGVKLWELPCLARGQGSDYEFKLVATDTPPGLYKLGDVYKDYESDPSSKYSRERMAYGWYSFDMIELENQESKYGRAGIMVHGGGSAAGWPGAWEPMQPLFPTHGCVRMHNIQLRDYLLPLYKKGTIYVSVYQERESSVNNNKFKNKVPQQALDLVKEFEGFSSKAYYDPLTGGLPITIGYGSTRNVNGTSFLIGDTITESDAEVLLRKQLETEYLPSLTKIPYWNEMNENQQSALLSFAYNLGAGFYGSDGFQTITRHLKNKEWKNVPDGLMLYVNPGTSVETGLRRRRIAEGKLWSTSS